MNDWKLPKLEVVSWKAPSDGVTIEGVLGHPPVTQWRAWHFLQLCVYMGARRTLAIFSYISITKDTDS